MGNTGFLTFSVSWEDHGPTWPVLLADLIRGDFVKLQVSSFINLYSYFPLPSSPVLSFHLWDLSVTFSTPLSSSSLKFTLSHFDITLSFFFLTYYHFEIIFFFQIMWSHLWLFYGRWSTAEYTPWCCHHPTFSWVLVIMFDQWSLGFGSILHSSGKETHYLHEGNFKFGWPWTLK